MGTQPTPWAPSPRRLKITEFDEIEVRMQRLEQQVADMTAAIAELLPLPAKPGVEYRVNYGDGIPRPVNDPDELERLRADGKGANIKPFPVQHLDDRIPPRPDLGPTVARYIGGN